MTSKLTREQLIERTQRKVKHLKSAISQSAFTGVRVELEEELQIAEYALACLKSGPAHVPDAKYDDGGSTTSEFDHGWNACRAAMLNGGN